jgi:hypothetical protein
MNWQKRSFTLVLSAVLTLTQTEYAGAVAQTTPAPSVQRVYVSTNELDQLVAPIALYPDNLVAQILAASAWPAEVVEADRWMQQHSGLTGAALAQAVNQQMWDPGVKALTSFPLVLTNMDVNLAWSTALGSAYANEPQMVLDAIQVMRWRAQRAGHLMPTSHQIVTYEGNTIEIQPADTGTVYLPEFDPWIVYGAPLAAYPGWDGLPGLFVTEPDIQLGVGYGVGFFAGFGWGWNHWRTDWRGQGVVFDQNPYRSYGLAFAHHPNFRATHMAFAAAAGFRGGLWRGATGASNRGFYSFHGGRIGGGFAARGGTRFGGGFHVASGGFHVGGFHGGGRR